MLSLLTRASIANRAVVALLTVLIVVSGFFSLDALRQELLPRFAAPQWTVLTMVPGASPGVVDKQATLPLSRAVRQVEGVDSVTATSSSGVSVVSLTTNFGLDQDKLKANVQDAIDATAPLLPLGAVVVRVASGGPGDMPAMTLTVSSELSPASLRERLTTVAVPRLRGISGVREVTVSGGTTQRVTVTPDMKALAAHGLSLQAISQALQSNGTQLPAGALVENGSIVGVQVGEALSSVHDMENLPLLPSSAPPFPGMTGMKNGIAPPWMPGAAPGGAPPGLGAVPPSLNARAQVLLGDVAEVTVADDPAVSITRVNGEPAVSVQITASSAADLVSLSHNVNRVLPGIEQALGSNTKVVVASDQAPLISESLQHLSIEGGLGLLFAVMVILLFLRSGRPTVVTAISIPLSIMATFIGLYLWDYSLNMFTLGALTIAIGRVVDDSIVVIENIKRHTGYGEGKVKAILDGTSEVAAAITSSTVATVLVFVPIALVEGFVGQLFGPFALTITIAMLSSLVIALTIVPVLSYWFLKVPVPADSPLPAVPSPAQQQSLHHEDEDENLLQRYYIPILRWTMRRPAAVILAAVMLLGGSLLLLPHLGVAFLGDTGETTISVSQSFDSSLTLDEVTAKITGIEALMHQISGVTDVVVTASLAGAGPASAAPPGPPGEASGDTTARYTVATSEGADITEIENRLKNALSNLPEADSITVGTTPPGGIGGSSVDVKITSADESVLEEATRRVNQALADVPHTTDISNNLAADQPTLQVQVDRAKAASYGLSEQAVAGIVASAMTPRAVTSVTIGDTSMAVYVVGPKVDTLAKLKALQLAPGAPLTLAHVATVKEISGPSSVSRSGTDLVATVSLTPEEGELGTVQSAVNERLDALDLPEGAKISMGGVSEQQSEAFRQLGLSMLVAVGLIFMLLVAILRSTVQPFILMISIPFAAIGAIGLLFITGTPLGVAAMIGMLMLIGIVVTNAIVLMDLINQYRRSGQSVKDAIIYGAGRRVRPIVMTALATICALLPMASGVTGGSGFISKTLAIVVIGGLISSTALTLLLVPAIYQSVEGWRERRRTQREQRVPPLAASAGTTES